MAPAEGSLHMRKEARLTIDVDVECEACGKRYVYAQGYHETGGGMSDPAGAIQKRIMQGELGWKRCPQCGYMQSWMVMSWKVRWSLILGVVTAMATLALAICIFQPSFGPEVTGSAYGWLLAKGVGTFLLGMLPGVFLGFGVLKPNRAWHKKNGFPEIAPKTPTVKPH